MPVVMRFRHPGTGKLEAASSDRGPISPPWPPATMFVSAESVLDGPDSITRKGFGRNTIGGFYATVGTPRRAFLALLAARSGRRPKPTTMPDDSRGQATGRAGGNVLEPLQLS